MTEQRGAFRGRVLLIERLELLTVFVWVWLAWRYRGGYFVSWSRALQSSRLRGLVTRLTGLRQLRYEEFPGTYFEVQRLAAKTANDALYDNSRGLEAAPIIAFLRGFRDHELMEVALRRALQDTYTVVRVKTLIFLRELSRTHGKIVLFPRDSRDVRPWLPTSLGDAWTSSAVPGIVRLANFVRARLDPLAVAGYATFLVAYLVKRRGLALITPTPRHWRVGFDMFDEGIQWGKPHHDFFLYDDRDLSPQDILHVVRNRLQDDRTRRYYEEHGIPFVESIRLSIPLGYLLRRMLWNFWGGTLRLVASQARNENTGPFLWAAMTVLRNLIRVELLETSHRTDVFVGRDEYGVVHILRTLVYDQRGGVTVGFSHGDDTSPTVANSYQSCHVFCFPGEFHRKMLEWNTRFSRSTCVIGAGLYGLDETHRRIQTGSVPDRYADLSKEHRFLGAFASSFQDDFFLTREMTLRFYRTVFAIPKRYPDVIVVVRPKGNEFADPEFRRLVDEAGSRVILEEKIWTYDLLPIFDLIICIAVTSVGLEGIMAGRPIIYFDESEFRQHPYEQYDPFLVARSPEELLSRIDQVLAEGRYVDPAVLNHIRSYHGLRFDGKVVERLRQVVYTALDGTVPEVKASATSRT